jgi:hypothetical protein
VIYPAPTIDGRKNVSEQQPWGGAPQPGPYPPAGPPPAGGAGGVIALTLKYMPLAFLFGLFKPVVELNGQPTPVRSWGRHEIPVPPGQYHLHIHVPYLLPPRVGNADLPLYVNPGQTAELEYRAPTIAFLNGALGAPPQKYPGLVATWIIMGLSLLILLCVCGGIIIAAVNGSSSSSLPALPALVAGTLRAALRL